MSEKNPVDPFYQGKQIGRKPWQTDLKFKQSKETKSSFRENISLEKDENQNWSKINQKESF